MLINLIYKGRAMPSQNQNLYYNKEGWSIKYKEINSGVFWCQVAIHNMQYFFLLWLLNTSK